MDKDKDNKIKGKLVKTYAEDMAKVIEYNEGGLIKKIIHEQEAHELEKKNLSPDSGKNRAFLYISILLILLAVGILSSYVVLKKQISTVEVKPQFTPLVYVDGTSFSEVGGLTKEKVAQTVSNVVNNTKVATDDIEGIYLTENKRVVGLTRFIDMIKGSLVLDKIIFTSDNFMLGVVNKNTKDFFILLKVSSFTNSFPAFRSWESKMFNDLHRFFGYTINADTNYLNTKSFEDAIIENKNARVLYDKDGAIVLMYIFADDTSVVFADTEEAMKEVMIRLAASNTKK